MLAGVLVAAIPKADALFSRAACFGNACVQRNRAGTLCYFPDPHHKGHGPCTTQALQNVLEAHRALAVRASIFARYGTSTAYYDLNGTALGGANWAFPQGLEAQVAVCHTGIVRDATFETTCRLSHTDNDFDDLSVPRCSEIHGHDERVLVDKCCGAPRTLCPPSAEPTWQRALDTDISSFAPTALVLVIAGLSSLLLRWFVLRLRSRSLLLVTARGECTQGISTSVADSADDIRQRAGKHK